MDYQSKDRYKEIDLVGEGSYGKVYKARDRFLGHVVALKKVKKHGKKRSFLKDLKKEFDILKMLSHPNIICLIDIFETENEIVAVTDFAEGDLLSILQDDHTLPEPVIQNIAGQLVSALYYLHANMILHRDMKPQNILVSSGSVVKLCDFGFARTTSSEIFVMTSVKGTPLYMSPELIDEKPYDHSTDLWAMGCILYELYHGHPPFNTDRLAKLIDMILCEDINYAEDISAMFKDFVSGLLVKDRDERMQWPDIIVHPFIIDYISIDDNLRNKNSHFTQPLTQSMALKKMIQEDKKLKMDRPKRLQRQPKKEPPLSE